MHGKRSSPIGKVRRKAKALRNQISWGVSGKINVSSVAQFRLAHAISAIFASPNHRILIHLNAGCYRMCVESAVGVDLHGEAGTRILWDGPQDTLDLNGTDTHVTGLEVFHEGPEFFYAIHADSPGPGGAILTDVFAYSDAKSALGVGLQPDQSFSAIRCHFERGSMGLISEPVLGHNSYLGKEGSLHFEDCTAHSATGGALSVWTDVVNGVVSQIPDLREGPSRVTPVGES